MEYDVAVIGGGPGGYVAAIASAKLGKKTVLIEKDKCGGTCLNRGCIPTKALLHCSELYKEAKTAINFGVNLDVKDFDYSKCYDHKEATSKKLRGGVEYLLKKSGCDVKFANGELLNDHTVKAGDETVTFKNLIIATGSVPAPNPFKVEEGAPLVNSDGFLELKKLPKKVLIVGGGVIGLEFATVLSEFESEVTVVEATPGVLPNMDREVADFAKSGLEKKGVKFFTGTFVMAVKKKGKKALVELKTGDKNFEETADLVVVAAGRRANTEGLNIKAAGVNTERGFITVDDRCCTNVPHIYAIGDVNGKSMLAHAASEQGKIVAENIAKGKNLACDFDLVPGCIYTHPEVASVGLTEQKAKDAGINVKVGRFNAAGNGKLLSMGAAEGFVKLVTDADTGEILGGQICCEHATDMISEISVAIKLESTVHELASTIHPHPTVSEMVMEAADDALGMCIHQ